ncbi:hypothetical protein ACQR0Y_13180 [Bradyrhizobium oligotrophicum]|uniref:hypothetical protein n=1 Tax=Bradyrhizobium oligotrophicum TaxID=44255 RepID=UPI003EBCCEF8
MKIESRADDVAGFDEVDLAGNRQCGLASERGRGRVKADAAQLEAEQVEKVDLLRRDHRDLEADGAQQHRGIARKRRLVEHDGDAAKILQKTVGELALTRAELGGSGQSEIELITAALARKVLEFETERRNGQNETGRMTDDRIAGLVELGFRTLHDQRTIAPASHRDRDRRVGFAD